MIERHKVEDLMKRAQRGVGGRYALDEAHDFMADAYGVLGRLLAERDTLGAIVAQRGGRLQVLRAWMSSADWHLFLHAHPGAVEWFDSDGVPK